MSKQPKTPTQNETDLTIVLMIIGGIILTIAAVLFLAFSAGFPG